MKRILSLLLVLVMCVGVFAGCNKNKNEQTDVTLEQAKDYLYNIMKDKNGKATPNDYDVVGKIIIDTATFEVTWLTDNENIVVKESSKANCWTIDVPSVNETEVTYTLTATIKDATGDTIEVSFTPKLPVIDNAGVETEFKEGVAYKIFMKQINLGYTVYALNTTQNGENKYIETTMDPKEAATFYVEVVEPADAVLVCEVVVIAEQNYDSRFKDVKNFFNKKGEVVRGYVLHKHDIYELSEEGFEGKPEVGKTVTITGRKHVVA